MFSFNKEEAVTAYSSSDLVAGLVYYPMIVLVFGVGDSIIGIALTTLYSEIIGPRRQGTLQGVLQMSGSIGSMLAPLISRQVMVLLRVTGTINFVPDFSLYMEFGPQAPWSLAIAEISVVVALWLAFHKKMVPLRAENMSAKSTAKEEP
ncbi:unnamed protein product [Haemonchus placei]|uniref:MFS domain-containing protein n=1 Tax=Haemonchus placei TaxID=6290 RepID=A0A0N4X4C0_HAEPC|nr:unnamed protein product [Haemonchus placei]